MRHISIKMDTPCEFINITPVNPLISKCEIKVCYVGDEPNRNRSIITKDVAKQMANSLPGSPIVGFYNETLEDFEEHNKIIKIANGKIEMQDATKPYGFVDLNAKVWFQKFIDDEENEHEYLMTEGYLWTGQFPEAKRIIAQGNNQSMEFDQSTLNGTWTKDMNNNPKFFIVNEAIISKLCILGDDAEPCFEGSTITEPTMQFSFDDGFKQQMFTMMNELKELIKEGGTPVFNTFAVEIGNALWDALYTFIETKFPRDLVEGETEDCYRCSKYYIDSIWEDGSQKFVILQERANHKLFRMNFSWDNNGFSSDGELSEVEKTYVPVSEDNAFSLVDIQNYEEKRYNFEDKTEKENIENSDNISEENKENSLENEGEIIEKPEGSHEEEAPKSEYSLEDIPEYTELLTKFSALEEKFNALEENYSTLETENQSLKEKMAPLVEFKAQAEKKEKQEMIDSFYMLSDEDKEDVIENIDSYSLNDIEAKLSIMCVRNKVSFDLNKDTDNNPTVYNLNSDGENDNTPAWVKAALAVSQKKN